MSYDDAFTIEEVAISAYDDMNSCTQLINNMIVPFVKVEEDLISKFNYVAGIIPIIKAYINEVGC